MKAPSYAHKHFPFIKFTDFGYSEMPDYFNVVREPAERLRSLFESHLKEERNKTDNDLTPLDECVRDPKCIHFWSQMRYNALPFFCGTADICVTDSAESLEKAKDNIDKYYGPVGLNEDLASFMEMLEFTYPTRLSGVSKILAKLVKQKTKRNESKYKYGASQETRDILNNVIFKHEHELYKFVKQRFYDQYSEMKDLKSCMKMTDIKKACKL